jgi:hypothetical protein
MTTQRLPNWPELLATHLSAVQAIPFGWSTHDCCTFAGDAVRAITGTDPMADLRGTYSTALQAAKVLQAEGGLPVAVSKRLGFGKLPALAQRGDVILFNMHGHGPALGICTGPLFAAPGEQGMEFFSMSAAQTAWGV